MTPNAHAGACSRCQKIVQPGDGFVTGRRGAWTCIHKACIPVADHKKYNTKGKSNV